MDLVLFKDRPKALTGHKGRDEIADLVHGSLHSREQIRSCILRSVLNYENPKEIRCVKYWTDRAISNVDKLQFMQEVYVTAYPKKGKDLFTKIVERCKIIYEKLQEMYTRKDYYYQKSMDAFNNVTNYEHWNKRIDELDLQISRLENSK